MEDNYRYGLMHRLKRGAVERAGGCLEYRATSDPYGLVSVMTDGKRKHVPASRAMYMAHYDCLDLPRSVLVLRGCGNARCINVAHLSRSGVGVVVSGDSVVRKPRIRKLSDEQVREIRIASGGCSGIAKLYGVARQTVYAIKSGRSKGLVSSESPCNSVKPV